MEHRKEVDARAELRRLAESQKSLELRQGARVVAVHLPWALCAALTEQAREQNVRGLIPDRVRQYAADMAAGRWVDNYDPLVVSAEFWILNGQHRLAAAARAQRDLWCLLVVNAPCNSREGQDTGKSRTLAQSHEISNADGAVARLYLLLKGNTVDTSRSERADVAREKEISLATVRAALGNRNICRRAECVVAFLVAFEKSGQPGSVLQLAEDLGQMHYRHQASRAITKVLESATTGIGDYERGDKACAIMWAIEADLTGKPIQIARPSTKALRRWVPDAEFRNRSISPALSARHRTRDGSAQ